MQRELHLIVLVANTRLCHTAYMCIRQMHLVNCDATNAERKESDLECLHGLHPYTERVVFNSATEPEQQLGQNHHHCTQYRVL